MPWMLGESFIHVDDIYLAVEVDVLPYEHRLMGDATTQPRSSHALAMPEVIGLADMLRGRPLVGLIVVIGTRRFALGRPLARRVATAVPALSRAIRVGIERVTEALRDGRDSVSPWTYHGTSEACSFPP
jgi:hypothetical protein